MKRKIVLSLVARNTSGAVWKKYRGQVNEMKMDNRFDERAVRVEWQGHNFGTPAG